MVILLSHLHQVILAVVFVVLPNFSVCLFHRKLNVVLQFTLLFGYHGLQIFVIKRFETSFFYLSCLGQPILIIQPLNFSLITIQYFVLILFFHALLVILYPVPFLSFIFLDLIDQMLLLFLFVFFYLLQKFLVHVLLF